MTQPQYFLGLNGPPGSGKDTLADGLAVHPWVQEHFLVQQVKYSAPLKHAAHALFGGEYTEAGKAEKSPYGPTWRELYISLSENYAKPYLGDQIFGQILVERMKAGMTSSRKPTIWLCSDCGFLEEQAPVINHLGPQNCKYINLVRDGYSFAGDSRSYIKPVGCETLTYNNFAATPRDAQVEFNFHLMQLINDWGWSR